MKKIVKSFNNTSPENRSFLSNTIFNFIFTGLKIAIGLITIPILLNVIGEEKFGIWQTILSFTSFITLLNLGYANGLRNLITKLLNSDRRNEVSKAIGATYIKLSKVAAISAFILLPAIYFLLDPNELFLDSSISSQEITGSLIIFVSFFILNIVLGLSESIAFGFQKSFLTSLFQAISVIISLVIILFLSKTKTLNLIHIALVFGLSQSGTYLLFILFQRHKLKIKVNLTPAYSLKETNKLSFHFFIAHLLAIAFLSIDNFIISTTLGAEETASYSIINKVYFTLISIFSIFLIHFWNSATQAYEKKQFKWILKKVKLLVILAIMFFALGIGVSFFQENIIKLWLGNHGLNLKNTSFLLFSIYLLFHCINAIFLNLQNGLGILKTQILTAFLALFFYCVACYFIDLKYYGYNAIIIIKIVVIGLSMIANSVILKKLKG